MPTSDRRPRARRTPDAPKMSRDEVMVAMHAAKGDPDAWAALKPHYVRTRTSSNCSAEQAARMFDAYGRKPYLLPRLPPFNFTKETE